MHKILIVPGRHMARGQVYSVYMGERLLVDRTYDPEHAACRVLADEGLSGLVETYWPGKPYACMRLDIQRAAGRTVADWSTGLVSTKHRPENLAALNSVTE